MITDIDIYFFFNDTATTEIYTLSLHDALPICDSDRHLDELAHHFLEAQGLDKAVDYSIRAAKRAMSLMAYEEGADLYDRAFQDRKSTRLNSSHANISYAVFCLKKKNQT